MKLFCKVLVYFTCTSVVLLGIPEYFLHHYGVEHPDVGMRHYEIQEMDGTDVYTFVPTPGCRLPPCQPYSLQFALNAIKITVFVLLLGVPGAVADEEDEKGYKVGDRVIGQHNNTGAAWFKATISEVRDEGEYVVDWDDGSREDRVKEASELRRKPEVTAGLFKRVVITGLTVYQCIMVPLSMVLTIYHFIGTISEFPSRWAAHECFGILWTMGPWWFNGLFLFTKFFMSFGVGVQSGNQDPFPNGLKVPLFAKDEPTESDVEVFQTQSFALQFALTLGPYVIIWFPFVVTHLLYGLVVFWPVVGLVALLLLGVFVFTARFSDVDFGREFTIDFDVDVNKTGGLLVLPLLLIMSVLAEVVALQMTYWYAGDGYVNSIAETWLERQTSIYAASFHAKVLHMWYASVDLLNEAI